MLCLGYEKSIRGKEGWRGVMGEWGRNREQWMKTKSWKVKITQNNLWFLVFYLCAFPYIFLIHLSYYPSSTLLYPSFLHVFILYLKHRYKMFIKQTLCLLFYNYWRGRGGMEMKTRREVWRRKGEDVFCLVISGYVGP